jgi:hypothetical protein
MARPRVRLRAKRALLARASQGALHENASGVLGRVDRTGDLGVSQVAIESQQDDLLALGGHLRQGGSNARCQTLGVDELRRFWGAVGDDRLLLVGSSAALASQ